MIHLFAIWLSIFAAVGGAPTPPAPAHFVTDGAGLLSAPARASLDARLEAYQHASGHQVVVWIGTTLGDAPLDDWAVRTFAAWKVGRQGKDDGVAIFVFAQDHKIDIEVGYGLEGSLPDLAAAHIIQNVMAPRMKAGDADGAITAGVEAVMAAINGGAAPTEHGTTQTQRTLSPFQMILYGIAAIFFLILLATHPRWALFFMWSIMSGGRGGGGGGGGFSGGGGRSGGGGARGSW